MVLDVQRHGKVLIFELSGGVNVSVQLGMSGRFAFRPFGQPHDHFSLNLGPNDNLTYNDFRRFGRVIVGVNARDFWRHYLGPDALSREFRQSTLAVSSKRSIKAVLLDQKTVSGLGNIYACEALFRAGIRPTRIASNLTGSERSVLVRAIKETLREAVKHGGSTLDDYRGTEGEAGDFEKHFGVYGRTGEPCRKCGPKARIAKIAIGNRATYFCRRCQC